MSDERIGELRWSDETEALVAEVFRAFYVWCNCHSCEARSGRVADRVLDALADAGLLVTPKELSRDS